MSDFQDKDITLLWDYWWEGNLIYIICEYNGNLYLRIKEVE